MLQFGHGLLCRGNVNAAALIACPYSCFNSATACYAVETKTVKFGERFREPKLQFGHGLLCRGNPLP